MSSSAEKMEMGEPVPAVAVTGLTPVEHAGSGNNNSAVMISRVASTGVPMYQQEKVGAKCCGCCCDYRRAVIIVSIIFIVASGLSLIFAIVGATAPGVNTVDDDTLIALTDSNVTLNIVVAAVGLAMAITGLIGARMYNIPMLAIVAVWFLVSFGIGVYTIIDTINLYNDSPNTTEDYRIPYGWLIFQFVVTCLWIYPFLGLIAEIKKGIMSYETYPREEYSCCCVSNTGRRLQ